MSHVKVNHQEDFLDRDWGGRGGQSTSYVNLNGSFANTPEDKYDFFDTDRDVKIMLQDRVPIFPEDFEPGQKQWPLSWWGIVEPSQELLEEHKTGYPKLTCLLEEKKREEESERQQKEYRKQVIKYENSMQEYEKKQRRYERAQQQQVARGAPVAVYPLPQQGVLSQRVPLPPLPPSPLPKVAEKQQQQLSQRFGQVEGPNSSEKPHRSIQEQQHVGNHARENWGSSAVDRGHGTGRKEWGGSSTGTSARGKGGGGWGDGTRNGGGRGDGTWNKPSTWGSDQNVQEGRSQGVTIHKGWSSCPNGSENVGSMRDSNTSAANRVETEHSKWISGGISVGEHSRGIDVSHNNDGATKWARGQNIGDDGGVQGDVGQRRWGSSTFGRGEVEQESEHSRVQGLSSADGGGDQGDVARNRGGSGVGEARGWGNSTSRGGGGGARRSPFPGQSRPNYGGRGIEGGWNSR